MGASTGNTKITSVIQFENVSKTFSIRNGASTHRVAALASVSLEIQAGEFVFLTGPSGAGKSTLIRLVLGLENVDQGEVFCIGQNLKTLSERKRRNLRQNVGIIFQDHKLIQSLNVRDNIHLPLSFTSISRKAARKRVDQLLEMIGMNTMAQAPIKNLSAGEKQRVALARALAPSPKLIIADEPTGNLDPYTARSTIRLLRELKAFGSAVLIATHDMGLVRDFGGRVLELIGGHLPQSQKQSFKIPEFIKGKSQSL